MSTPEESVLDELLAYELPKIAKQLARKFPTLDGEDVFQQCWLGVLEHKDELRVRLAARGPDMMLKAARDYAAKAVRSLRSSQDQHERARRALEAGYRAEDEFFYSVGLLRSLLPVYLDKGVTADPLQGREMQEILDHADGATGAGWLALMTDVDHAYWKLSKYQRNLLTRYFSLLRSKGGGPEWSHLDVASAMGIQPEALEARVGRALRAMQRLLGGENPWLRTG